MQYSWRTFCISYHKDIQSAYVSLWLLQQHVFFMVGRGETPPIPTNLSNDAHDFITQCVQANPADRPSASQLLEHPFVRGSLPFLGSRPDYSSSPANNRWNWLFTVGGLVHDLFQVWTQTISPVAVWPSMLIFPTRTARDVLLYSLHLQISEVQNFF